MPSSSEMRHAALAISGSVECADVRFKHRREPQPKSIVRERPEERDTSAAHAG